MQTEWRVFLKKIQQNDSVAFIAIKGFQIAKKGEDELEIIYTSESAKEEFDKCKDQFINSFKHKVQHYSLSIIYKKVEGAVKKEIVTKKNKFEKLVQINPLFQDLNDLLQFDFS